MGSHTKHSYSHSKSSKKYDLNKNLQIICDEHFLLSYSKWPKSFTPTYIEKIQAGEKVHYCKECYKPFLQKDLLKEHATKHGSAEYFDCNICNSSFIRFGVVTCIQHMPRGKQKLRKTFSKSYQCSVCNVSFMHRSDLRKHKEIHPGEIVVSCDSCGKTFSKKYTLQKHVQSHNNVQRRRTHTSRSDIDKQIRHDSDYDGKILTPPWLYLNKLTKFLSKRGKSLPFLKRNLPICMKRNPYKKNRWNKRPCHTIPK